MARTPQTTGGTNAASGYEAQPADTPVVDREAGDEESLPPDLALNPPEAAAAPPVRTAQNPAYIVIAREGLNLRSGPGTEFPVITSIPLNSRVFILRREGSWALIDREGDGIADGHVHMSFLREESTTGPSAGAHADFVPLDKTLVQTIMNRCAGVPVRPRLDLDMIADALNRAMLLAEAGTRLREVAFLSQSVIESDYFRTFREYGLGQGKPYGNYYGRGMHQLTWKETYAACSRQVFGDDRLVRNPDLIVDDIEVNIKATAWYWRDYKPFNRLSDAEDIDEIIYRLYGGRITSNKPAVRKSVMLRRGYYTSIRAILEERANS